jgi:hypothetical protein
MPANVGYEVAFRYGMLTVVTFSFGVHVYAMVDVAEAGECEGYTQGSKDAFDEVRVRLVAP